MGLIIGIVVLWLLSRSSSSSTQHEGETKDHDAAGGESHEPEHEDPLGDLVDAAGGLGATVLGLGGGAGTAVGATTGTATLGGGGSAAGAGLSSGGAAKAAATGVGGGGTAGGASSGGATALAPVTVASSVQAGPLVVMGLVVIIIICNEIAKAQEAGKDLQWQFRALGRPSPQALNRFEAQYAAQVWRTQTPRTAMDPRFRLSFAPSTRLVTSDQRGGERVEFPFVAAPPPAGPNGPTVPAPLTVSRQARTLAWEHMQARSEYCCRLNRNWERLNESGWPLQAGATENLFGAWWNNPRLFDDIMPGLDGLPGVPLIDGRTVAPRVDRSSIVGVTADELRAPLSAQQIPRGDPSVTPDDVKLARLSGLVTVALWACRNVPSLKGHTDARVMAGELKRHLELSGDEAVVENWSATITGRNVSRWGLRLPASKWALECRFDVMIAKSGTGDVVTEVA